MSDQRGTERGTIDASTAALGMSTFRNAALVATVIALKASPGNLYGWNIENPNLTQDVFIQLWDLATGGVTVGTTTPKLSIWVPAGGGIDTQWTIPIGFGTAISIACTTTASGSTAPGTGAVVNAFYV